MRLHVLSDLHLERGTAPPAAVDADVVILAGDIAGGVEGVRWAGEWAGGRPVLYIAGNHEFYGYTIPGLIDELRAAAAGTSVHVLENDEVRIDGVRFLGCTLWSDFDFAGAQEREASMELCRRVVNDFEHIRFGPGDRALAPRDTRTFHLASRRWLATRLAEPHDGPTVVITHHAPLIRGRPQAAAMRALGGAFASDVTELMGAEQVELWVYGHVHRSADLEVRGTHVLSNPAGYPRETVTGYDPSRIVELGNGRAQAQG